MRKKSEAKITNEIMIIEWEDPYSVDEWTRMQTFEPKPLLVSSCGYLVKETADTYVLAISCQVDNGDMSNALIVPKRCVNNIRKIAIKRA